uniref:DUF4493 domain-containing protein n=1 Tax=Phocaeicola coprocola TaxID=310298 RepID=UPI0040262FBA
MKRNILYILCGIFLLVGCQQKELLSGTGYMSVSGIEIQSQAVAEVASRTTDDITWTVELWKGEEMLRTLSSEDMQNKIELDAAEDYMLKVYTPNYGVEKSWTNAEKGEPVYYAEVPFVVNQGETTGLKVQVPMITFAVSLDLSKVIGGWLQDYSFTVTSGERVVSLTDGETAYFPYSEGVSFGYELSVTNSDSEVNVLKGEWGVEAEEPVNINTVYTVVYNWDTQSLSLTE